MADPISISDKVRILGKNILSNVLPDSHRLKYLTSLPQIRKWKKEYLNNTTPKSPYFSERSDLFNYLNKDVLNGEPVDFLEFGVFRGASLQLWSQVNSSKDSRFFGFDTFEGLPDDWDFFSSKIQKTSFSLKGKVPELADKRIQLIKGLFQETLEPFLKSFVPKNRLVIHIDCDLYAPSLYVLSSCHNFITKGTILLFDEFLSPLHEFRAFYDFKGAFYKKFRVLGAAGRQYDHVAFETIE